MKQAKLIEKKYLTHNVFELKYLCNDISEMIPGQFITFILPWIWGRAYSILSLEWNICTLIIKKWEKQEWGRWGSIFLCDAEIWEIFSYVWPSGHFTLKNSENNKLFLWTGTWLVPLYNMIISGLEKNTTDKYQLVFGVRYHNDMFYISEFEKLKEKFADRFYYHLVVSRDEAQWIVKKWYVTDFLSQKVVWDYEEYYICGAPNMISWCKEKLSELWVNPQSIFSEEYS